MGDKEVVNLFCATFYSRYFFTSFGVTTLSFKAAMFQGHHIFCRTAIAHLGHSRRTIFRSQVPPAQSNLSEALESKNLSSFVLFLILGSLFCSFMYLTPFAKKRCEKGVLAEIYSLCASD